VTPASAARRIFEIPEKNVQHIKQAQGLIDQYPGWVLRMRGLPYNATPDDVVCCTFQNPFLLTHAMLRHSIRQAQGSPTGAAWQAHWHQLYLHAGAW
jgi:hypothetical protein